MKLNSKAAGALLLSALFVGLSVSLTFWILRQIDSSSAAQTRIGNLIDSANDLLSAMKDAETGQRGYLLTGDEDYLQPYLAVRDGLGDRLKQLRQISVIEAAQVPLRTLEPLLQAKLAVLAQAIELRRNHNEAGALKIVNEGGGRQMMDAIRSDIGQFVQIENSAFAVQDAQFQSNMRRLFSLMVAASLLVLVAALAFAVLFYRQAQQRLQNLMHLQTLDSLAQQESLNQVLQQTNVNLQASEERLAVTLNSIGDAVITTDAQAQVTSLNPLAEQLTGWTQAQAQGQPIGKIFQIVHKDSRQPVLIPVIDALAHGTVQGLANHTVLLALDGHEYDIADSCAPIKTRDGDVIGAVLVFRNVTEEYAAQQLARDSSAQMQAILNTVVDGIITLRARDGRVETVNPAAQRMFGYSQAELLGENFQLLLPDLEGTPDKGGQPLEQFIEGQGSQAPGFGRELLACRKDGSIFSLEMTTSEMWLGGERHFTCILRDFTARKLAEDALLKAGALQSAIFNSANFSSIATDAQGVIQIFNVGAERMLGYSAAEVMNQRTPADISDPQEIIARAKSLSVELDTPITPGFEALVFKASRGIEDIYELTYIRKDGSRFPAVVSVTALRDVDDAIIGYLLIGTDNTARKQAEEDLLKTGALQKAIFDSANFSSIATDARGVIQIFNVGAERMLGYSAAEVMNQRTPADISDPQEIIARAKTLSIELDTNITPGFEALVFKASRGIEDIYELTYIRKDESRFPAVVSVTALRDQQEVIIGYLLIGTDNTARKQIEEERKKLDQRLRDQQFYTRSLIESNIDAIITTDPSGIITDVNKQMELLTDCTRDELIGAPFKNYFTDQQRAGAAISLALVEKKVTNYELTARTRDGLETVVSFNASTFYDRDRTLQGVFTAARDVTERKRLDQALQEKNVELESARLVADKANLAKSDFLSSMSHELRSPLNAILGFAQLMESETPPPTPRQKESLAQVLRAGWHLLTLINEILDLAKIESRQVPISIEPVSLAAILSDCQSMFVQQAQQRSVTLVFPPAEMAYFVLADQTRLKQVCINLLTNAIKYNKPQGTVEVSCKPVAQGRIRVSIRDTGHGLRPEQQSQLFQAFNRLGQEGSGVEGTGIGLVVAKQLVELMDGSIGMQSQVGQGSVFWFELMSVAAPAVPAEGSLVSLALPDVRDRAQEQTLLYVEDNPANMTLIEMIIARHPHLRLLTAIDGFCGFELACKELPDVILLDINLPGMDGFETLKLLRDDPRTTHIPALAISANAMPADIKKGQDAGFLRYLTKPIKVDEFMSALNAALEFCRSTRS